MKGIKNNLSNGNTNIKMETVSNLASAATTTVSRAIWGDQDQTDTTADVTKRTLNNETGGQEPVSGKAGNVKAGEPYDMGNFEPTISTSTPTTDGPTKAVDIETGSKTAELGAVTPTPASAQIPVAEKRDANTLLSYENLTSNLKPTTEIPALNTPTPSATPAIPKHEVDTPQKPQKEEAVPGVAVSDLASTNPPTTTDHPSLAGTTTALEAATSTGDTVFPTLTDRPEAQQQKIEPADPHVGKVNTTGSLDKVLAEKANGSSGGVGNDAFRRDSKIDDGKPREDFGMMSAIREKGKGKEVDCGTDSKLISSSPSKLATEQSPIGSDGTKEKKSLKEKIKEKLHHKH